MLLKFLLATALLSSTVGAFTPSPPSSHCYYYHRSATHISFPWSHSSNVVRALTLARDESLESSVKQLLFRQILRTSSFSNLCVAICNVLILTRVCLDAIVVIYVALIHDVICQNLDFSASVKHGSLLHLLCWTPGSKTVKLKPALMCMVVQWNGNYHDLGLQLGCYEYASFVRRMASYVSDMYLDWDRLGVVRDFYIITEIYHIIETFKPCWIDCLLLLYTNTAVSVDIAVDFIVRSSPHWRTRHLTRHCNPIRVTLRLSLGCCKIEPECTHGYGCSFVCEYSWLWPSGGSGFWLRIDWEILIRSLIVVKW